MHTKPEQPIRILQIVTNMSYGGLENLLMNYYRNIDRTKVQFDFLTHVSIHQDFEDEIRALGGKVYRLPRLNPFSIRYRRKLEHFFVEHPEYKIVHCHLDCMAGLPLKIAKHCNVPVRISHSHNSNQSHNLKYLIKLIYKRIIPKYSTMLFACGKNAGDWMFNGKPYTILHNAIDAQQFQYSPSDSSQMKELLNTHNQFVIGHIGKFRPQKNHLFLIDIFAEILKKDRNCCLVLVGTGPEMEATISKVKSLGLQDNVLFTGPRSDIPNLMQGIDVLLLPSLYEGLPVTIIEAQAAGLPCIISDGVPIECKLTDAVEQVALTNSPEIWADTVLKYRGYIRQNNQHLIKKAGYDINSNATWLEEFYCNAQREY